MEKLGKWNSIESTSQIDYSGKCQAVTNYNINTTVDISALLQNWLSVSNLAVLGRAVRSQTRCQRKYLQVT